MTNIHHDVPEAKIWMLVCIEPIIAQWELPEMNLSPQYSCPVTAGTDSSQPSRLLGNRQQLWMDGRRMEEVGSMLHFHLSDLFLYPAEHRLVEKDVYLIS